MEENENSLEYACKMGTLDKLIEEYVSVCSEACELGESAPKKCSKKLRRRFPNVAGFCRYFHIGDAEYERLCAKYPEDFERVKLVFEDEALNSGRSPALLNAYLKERLGYGDKPEKENDGDGIQLVFAHDILEDGE